VQQCTKLGDVNKNMEKIKEKTHNKVFANLTTLKIDLANAEQQLLDGSYKPLITREQQKQVIDGIESEIAIWNYIAKVTEFNF
jgi:hypothetical protein